MLYDKYKNVMGQHVTWQASTASGLGALVAVYTSHQNPRHPGMLTESAQPVLRTACSTCGHYVIWLRRTGWGRAYVVVRTNEVIADPPITHRITSSAFSNARARYARPLRAEN